MNLIRHLFLTGFAELLGLWAIYGTAMGCGLVAVGLGYVRAYRRGRADERAELTSKPVVTPLIDGEVSDGF